MGIITIYNQVNMIFGIVSKWRIHPHLMGHLFLFESQKRSKSFSRTLVLWCILHNFKVSNLSIDLVDRFLFTMDYHNPQGQLGSTSMYKSQEIHQQPGYLFFHGSFGGLQPEKKTAFNKALQQRERTFGRRSRSSKSSGFISLWQPPSRLRMV